MVRTANVFVGWLAIGLLLAPVQAEPIGSVFSYQGQLKEGGRPVDAACVLEFSLHDAGVGGTQVGPTLRFDGLGTNPPAIVVANGLFQADLNFGSDAFNGDVRWLQISVCCAPADCTNPLNATTLNPRQALTATPYALHTRGIASNDMGYVGIGTNSPQFPLEVQTSSATTAVSVSSSTSAGAASGATAAPSAAGARPTALEGSSSSMGGVGLSGDALATMGDGRGVLGRSSGDSGVGVFGRAFHPTGSTIGVFGEADSPDGIGVVGTAQVGVEGRADGKDGTGVRGVALLQSGRAIGVEGMSDSTDGLGVFGLAIAPMGIGVGVQGESLSPEGTGVVGSGLTKGVIGEATDPDAFDSFGVIGRTASSSGFGVQGEATATTGLAIGVEGLVHNLGIGVRGIHLPLSDDGVGVLGVTLSDVGFGVKGLHNAEAGDGVGVFGSTDSPNGFAGKFSAPMGNANALTVANPAGVARVQMSTLASDGGRIATFGPNDSENVTISSLSTNANHGFIDIRDAAGLEKLKAYVADTGSGVVQAQAPNGSTNVLVSSLIGSPFNGFIGVAGFSGSNRVKMFVEGSGAGTVQTLGFNGSSNVVIGTSGAVDDGPSQGAIEIVDENEATIIDMFLVNGQGNIEVSDDTGSSKVTLKSLNSAGSILTQGPNGLANVFISNTNSNLNLGSIWVGDTNGQPRALMQVDENGMGTVAADVKNFRIPNPNQPGTDIWYASVEGPEAAAYVRGTATLVDGKAVVTFPDHFKAVAVEVGMTVQLTPLSAESLGLAVVRKGLDGVLVRELHSGVGNYDFDYCVTAVRKGHENYRVIRPAFQSAVATTVDNPPKTGRRTEPGSIGFSSASAAGRGGGQ